MVFGMERRKSGKTVWGKHRVKGAATAQRRRAREKVANNETKACAIRGVPLPLDLAITGHEGTASANMQRNADTLMTARKGTKATKSTLRKDKVIMFSLQRRKERKQGSI
jgi:hypothetical protein